jgi:Tfp pilus assembly protein FimT
MKKPYISKEAVDGFSAIELVVLIVMIGILAAITWPRLSALAPKYRLQGATTSLAAAIQKARGQAIAQNLCVQVSFDNTNKTYKVATLTGASTCPTSGYPTTAPAIKVDDTGTIGIENANSPGNAPLAPIFNPQGRNSQASTIRVFNVDNDGRSISVNSAGAVFVQ